MFYKLFMLLLLVRDSWIFVVVICKTVEYMSLYERK